MHSNYKQEFFEDILFFIDECKYDTALKLCEQVLQTDRNNDLALYNGGLAYCMLQEYDKGIDYLKKVKNEYAIEANIMIGMFASDLSYLRKDKKYDEILIHHYKKAIEINPHMNNITELYIDIAGSYQSIGELENARIYFLKVIEEDAENSFAYAGLAYEAYERGLYENAKEYILEAIALNENESYFKDILARVYYELKLYDASIDEFLKIIELDEAYQDIYYNLSKSYFRQKKYTLALKYAEKDIIQNSDSSSSVSHFEKCKKYYRK